MSSVLSAELAATCSALGYYDADTNKYYTDSNSLETVKDLIRYLRRDDENHEIRRQLGDTKVLQTDLLPMMKSYWEETELFDVILRLLVNLTCPALMLWNEQVPTERTARNYYIQISDHLKSYKEAFTDEEVWSVLSRRLSKTLEIEYAERGDENSLIIERILILIRNILYIPIDPEFERPDNDASIHDQVLWALRESGMLDLILYISSSPAEQAYYMHILEIYSLMLREQKASELAKAAVQRTETEKLKDQAELLAIRHREAYERQQKIKAFTGARHSRFGGTYVVKSMKSISDNDLIYHKPLNKLDQLNFDADKIKPKTPKNRLPVSSNTFERKSALSIRLYLKEFCIEFLNGAYNTFMHQIKSNLVRGKGQDNDETYYFWALRFFMEMNRCYKFNIKLVSETVSFQTFFYLQQQIEKYYDMIQTDKKNAKIWSRRLHITLLAYKELLLTLCAMDKSPDQTLKDSSKVIQSNIFYIPDYRELLICLLVNYDELKQSDAYLVDLIETQHIFVKMLEQFCGKQGSVVVKKKVKGRKKKKPPKKPKAPALNLEKLWDETSPQLTVVLNGENFTTDIVPFDATSDVPIDEQRGEAMKQIQKKLRSGEFEDAIGLMHASREVWPDGCFGTSEMSKEEEFLTLQDIFFAEIADSEDAEVEQQEPEDIQDDEEDEEDYGDTERESELKFVDFSRRLAHPKIVRACGLALRNFERNSPNTNHCIVKLLHRIAFDCKMHVMIFQLSIFRTFQQIIKMKALPQYTELIKFAFFIMRQFLKVAEINKKVYMEMLFWKSTRDAYEIEEGYGTYKSQSTAKTWTDENEDELRRLFMEHREKQIDEDVVDWIVANLIDNTRTRREVLMKLRKMMLITDYKTKSGPRQPRVPLHWGEEEEQQLQELFLEFKDSMDPVGNIMARLDIKRTKNRIIEKLLVMGLIQDKKEVRKKRAKKTNKSKSGRRNSENNSDSNVSSDEDVSDDTSQRPTNIPKPKAKKNQTVHQTNKKNTKRKYPAKSIISKSDVTKVLNEMKSDFSEALEWLRDCFSDALEDLEDVADSDDGIPLVPIMDYAVDAMEDSRFQKLLESLGIQKPFDEREIYWRIPFSVGVDTLRNNINFISQALDNTLAIPTESQESERNDPEDDTVDRPGTSFQENFESDDYVTSNSQMRSVVRNLIDSESEDENIQSNLEPRMEENLLSEPAASQEADSFSVLTERNSILDENNRTSSPSGSKQNKKRSRIVINSDSEEENLNQGKQASSYESDHEEKQKEAPSVNKKPLTKRLKIIDSDDED